MALAENHRLLLKVTYQVYKAIMEGTSYIRSVILVTVELIKTKKSTYVDYRRDCLRTIQNIRMQKTVVPINITNYKSPNSRNNTEIKNSFVG